MNGQKKNMKLCHLEDKTIRFIADDANKILRKRKKEEDILIKE